VDTRAGKTQPDPGRERRPPVATRVGTHAGAGVLAVTVLAAGLRFATLDARGFWSDEVATVNVVAGGLADLSERLRETEGTPPLYYLLAWGWAQLFGTGEAGLRSLSALLGTATVPVAFLAGRTLVSRRVGLVAALLVAVNPMLVWYSQEARAYALLVLLGGASFVLTLRAREDPRPRTLLAWALVAILTVLTHYYGGFLIAVEAGWLAVTLRPRRAVAWAITPVLVTVVALVPLALEQRGGGARAAWIAAADLHARVVELPGIFLVGLETPRPVLAALLAALLVSPALVILGVRANARERAGALLAGGIGAVAIAVPLVLALAGFDYFIYKNMLATAVPLALVLAAGFGARRAGRLALGALAAFCALSLAVVVATATEPKHGREDWRTAAAALGRPTTDRAVVSTPGFTAAAPLVHYGGGDPVDGDTVSVGEIVLLAMARSESWKTLGASVRPRPPRPGSPPPPPAPGFRLVERRDAEHFTLLRYRSARPVAVSTRALERAAVGPEVGTAVVLQRAPGRAIG
jgi:mannosyltransferase